jgi:hypothetical protein
VAQGQGTGRASHAVQRVRHGGPGRASCCRSTGRRTAPPSPRACTPTSTAASSTWLVAGGRRRSRPRHPRPPAAATERAIRKKSPVLPDSQSNLEGYNSLIRNSRAIKAFRIPRNEEIGLPESIVSFILFCSAVLWAMPTELFLFCKCIIYRLGLETRN